MTTKPALAIGSAVLALVGCSSGSDDAPSASAPPSSSTAASSTAASSTETAAQTTGPSPTTSAATADPTTTATASTDAPSTTPPPTFPSASKELGLESIEQFTDTSGGGARPMLSWAAVDGASRYHVFVLSPSGVVYWGWQTTDTSVPVGGIPQLSDDAPGPAVTDDMTWSVSAADESGHIIALSPIRPISP